MARKAIYKYYTELRKRRYIFTGEQNDRCIPDISYVSQGERLQDNSIHVYIEKCCEFVPFDESQIHTDALYKSYLKYCEKMAITPIDSLSGFSQRFYGLYKDKVKKDKWRSPGEENGKNGFQGIRILYPYNCGVFASCEECGETSCLYEEDQYYNPDFDRSNIQPGSENMCIKTFQL